MFDKRAFQIAFVISLIIHTTIFFRLPQINFLRSFRNWDKNSELAYIIEQAKQPSLRFFNQEFPKKTSHQTSSKMVASAPHAQKEQIFIKLRDIPVKKPEFLKANKIVALEKKITLPKFRDDKITNPIYLDYYQTIREQIKRAAYQNYTRLLSGEVYLSFIILNNGQLKDTRIDEERSTTYAYLKDIAQRSIYDASPFPSFPKDLDYPELSFNAIISFEIEKNID